MPHTQSKVTHVMNERITDLVAVTAVATTAAPPTWFENMAGISQAAVTLTPILGFIWLLIQIIFKMHEGYAKYQDRKRQTEKERRDAERSNLARTREEVHRTQGDTWPEA